MEPIEITGAQQFPYRLLSYGHVFTLILHKRHRKTLASSNKVYYDKKQTAQ
jgi:hypothetical protein